MTTTYALTAAALLEAHPRASASDRLTACGDGVPQPGWGPCSEPAVWRVLTPWGAPYKAHYCSEHAAARIRAADYLAQLGQLREMNRIGTGVTVSREQLGASQPDPRAVIREQQMRAFGPAGGRSDADG